MVKYKLWFIGGNTEVTDLREHKNPYFRYGKTGRWFFGTFFDRNEGEYGEGLFHESDLKVVKA